MESNRDRYFFSESRKDRFVLLGGTGADRRFLRFVAGMGTRWGPTCTKHTTIPVPCYPSLFHRLPSHRPHECLGPTRGNRNADSHVSFVHLLEVGPNAPGGAVGNVD